MSWILLPQSNTMKVYCIFEISKQYDYLYSKATTNKQLHLYSTSTAQQIDQETKRESKDNVTKPTIQPSIQIPTTNKQMAKADSKSSTARVWLTYLHLPQEAWHIWQSIYSLQSLEVYAALSNLATKGWHYFEAAVECTQPSLIVQPDARQSVHTTVAFHTETNYTEQNTPVHHRHSPTWHQDHLHEDTYVGNWHLLNWSPGYFFLCWQRMWRSTLFSSALLLQAFCTSVVLCFNLSTWGGMS